MTASAQHLESHVNQYKEYLTAVQGLFTSLGPVHTRDNCLFGVPKPLLARQMMKLSKTLGVNDSESLLGAMRTVYDLADREARCGLQSDARGHLVDSLLEEIA